MALIGNTRAAMLASVSGTAGVGGVGEGHSLFPHSMTVRPRVATWLRPRAAR
jgi:hypothetical protein